MQLARSSWAWGAVTVLCLGCASAPSAPSPGTATVFGDLRLVPRDGVHVPAAGGDGGSYGDRKLRDVTLVDYARPGFAVVWLEGAPARGENARVTIRANEFETRLEPAWAALASGGTLELLNASPEAHTVSCPSLGVVKRLAPGESLALVVPETGAHALFLLDRPQVEGGVFAAPGPFAVPTQTGQYELRDVAPGHWKVHAWHPRFAPVARSADVDADETLRIDLEMGVGRGEESTP
jgi:hypothetical protein